MPDGFCRQHGKYDSGEDSIASIQRLQMCTWLVGGHVWPGENAPDTREEYQDQDIGRSRRGFVMLRVTESLVLMVRTASFDTSLVP